MSAREPLDLEVYLLRDFFDKWEALHAIKRDKLHRNKQEQAAQSLVEAAYAVRHFRSPVKLAS